MSQPDQSTEHNVKDQEVLLAGERPRLFWQILKFQSLMACLVVVLSALAGRDGQIVMAALAGAAISMSATTWAGYRTLMSPAVQTPAQMVAALYRGEVGKIVITLFLFVLVFKYWEEARKGVLGLALFSSYFVVQVVSWWAGKSKPTPDELACLARYASQQETRENDHI